MNLYILKNITTKETILESSNYDKITKELWRLVDLEEHLKNTYVIKTWGFDESNDLTFKSVAKITRADISK
jgi:hypothetical protein